MMKQIAQIAIGIKMVMIMITTNDDDINKNRKVKYSLNDTYESGLRHL